MKLRTNTLARMLNTRFVILIYSERVCRRFTIEIFRSEYEQIFLLSLSLSDVAHRRRKSRARIFQGYDVSLKRKKQNS